MFSNAAKIRQIFCPCNNTLIHRCTPFKFFHNRKHYEIYGQYVHYSCLNLPEWTDNLFSLYVLTIIYKYLINIP